MERLRPKSLDDVWRTVSGAADATETLDRRGFQLLQWRSPRSVEKPIELSLEHEARLRPAGSEGLCALLATLVSSLGQRVDRILLPSFKSYGDLILGQVERSVGAQSIDHYFDLPGGFEFISRGFTFRKRVRSSNFMTWNSEKEGLSTLNLELPAVDLQTNGMIARLEFNWKDELALTLQEAAVDRPSQNPAHFAAQIAGLDLRQLEAVLENTTVRQKFLGRGSDGKAMFALNVDFIKARNLRDGSEARFVDVDVSGMHFVDQKEFDALAELSGQLMKRYELRFNFATKASRAVRELDQRIRKALQMFALGSWVPERSPTNGWLLHSRKQVMRPPGLSLEPVSRGHRHLRRNMGLRHRSPPSFLLRPSFKIHSSRPY
jgi:hypothetical protein